MPNGTYGGVRGGLVSTYSIGLNRSAAALILRPRRERMIRPGKDGAILTNILLCDIIRLFFSFEGKEKESDRT